MKAQLVATLLHLAAPGTQYQGTVVRPIDGDTIRVSVPAWANTPFDPIDVRIAGIDTPETRKPPAKCKAEVALGKAASAYAKTLLRPGDAVVAGFRSIDKYGARIDATLALPDGRDFGSLMISSGMAVPYDGGTKHTFCTSRKGRHR